MEGVERTRSLTKQRSPSSPPDAKEVPDLPARESNGDEKHVEEGTGEDTRQPKSPLLTSHRASTSSLDNAELDNVNLDEDTNTEKPESTDGEYHVYKSTRNNQAC